MKLIKDDSVNKQCFDPRVPIHDLTNRPSLPDWKALKVPVLDISDFLHIPRTFIRSYILARKIRRQFHLHLLKTTEMSAKCFDFELLFPLLSDGIGHDLARYGFRELDHRYLIMKIIKPHSIIYDLGANIGYYVAMYGRLMNNSGFIYAIEPDPRNVEYLRKNITLNGMSEMVRIEPIAISDHDGVASFHCASARNLSGLYPSNLPRNYDKIIEVPVRDLVNHICSIPQKIDLLRMDIEGHEVEVLGSLAKYAEKEKTVQWAPKRILFEGHAWEYTKFNQNSMLPVIERLFRYGYRAKYLCNAMEHFSPIRSKGYIPEVVIDAGHRYYGIYKDIKNDDAVQLISENPAITTICIEQNSV